MLSILEWGQKTTAASGAVIINCVMAPLFGVKEDRSPTEAPPVQAPESEPIPIHLFLDTALEILNNTADAQEGICSVLELTAQTLRLDRAYLALFGAPEKPPVSWQWSAPHLTPLAGSAAEDLRELLPHFDADGLCVLNGQDALPEPLRALVERCGIRALLCSLLYKNDKAVGVLCVHGTEDVRLWQSNEIDLIQSCAKLLVNPSAQAQSLATTKNSAKS